MKAVRCMEGEYSLYLTLAAWHSAHMIISLGKEYTRIFFPPPRLFPNKFFLFLVVLADSVVVLADSDHLMGFISFGQKLIIDYSLNINTC